jgi:hypothetical protein
MFNLSGAINVLLFLIIRPELLLFPRPKVDGQEIQLPPQGNGREIEKFSDTEKSQHGPERTSAAQGNEGSRNSATQSRPISDDI